MFVAIKTIPSTLLLDNVSNAASSASSSSQYNLIRVDSYVNDIG